MIKLHDSAEISNKEDLTIIKIDMEMPVDDYKKFGFDVDSYPLDAWAVWVLKYHDTDLLSFEVCNKGLRVSRNLTGEEKAAVMVFLTEHGYEKILRQENGNDFQ